jgi:hypothetical protein
MFLSSLSPSWRYEGDNADYRIGLYIRHVPGVCQTPDGTISNGYEWYSHLERREPGGPWLIQYEDIPECFPPKPWLAAVIKRAVRTWTATDNAFAVAIPYTDCRQRAFTLDFGVEVPFSAADAAEYLLGPGPCGSAAWRCGPIPDVPSVGSLLPRENCEGLPEPEGEEVPVEGESGGDGGGGGGGGGAGAVNITINALAHAAGTVGGELFGTLACLCCGPPAERQEVGSYMRYLGGFEGNEFTPIMAAPSEWGWVHNLWDENMCSSRRPGTPWGTAPHSNALYANNVNGGLSIVVGTPKAVRWEAQILSDIGFGEWAGAYTSSTFCGPRDAEGNLTSPNGADCESFQEFMGDLKEHFDEARGDGLPAGVTRPTNMCPEPLPSSYHFYTRPLWTRVVNVAGSVQPQWWNAAKNEWYAGGITYLFTRGVMTDMTGQGICDPCAEDIGGTVLGNDGPQSVAYDASCILEVELKMYCPPDLYGISHDEEWENATKINTTSIQNTAAAWSTDPRIPDPLAGGIRNTGQGSAPIVNISPNDGPQPLNYTETTSAVADGTAEGLRRMMGEFGAAIENAGEGGAPAGLPATAFGNPTGEAPGMAGSGDAGAPGMGESISDIRGQASGIASGVADGMGLGDIEGIAIPAPEAFVMVVPMPWVDGTTKEFELPLIPDATYEGHEMLVDVAGAIRMICLWIAHLVLGYSLVVLLGKVT